MSDRGRSLRRGALAALGFTLAALVGCGSGSSGGVVSSVTTVSGSVASGSGGLPLLVAGATHGATTGLVVILELSDGRTFRQSVAAGIREFSIGVQNAAGLGARILVEYNGQVLYQDILGPLGTGAVNRQQVGPASTLVALLAGQYLGIQITGASNLTSLTLPGGGTLDLNALRQQVDQNPTAAAFANLITYLARIANGTASCSLADLASGSCSDAAIGSLLSDIRTLAQSKPAPKTSGGGGAGLGSATLVSKGIGGSGQGGGVAYPRISTTGQFVAWPSFSDGDLVAGDSNGKSDCFVRDMTAGTTQRISVALAGQPDGDCRSPDVSGDGAVFVYTSEATNAVSPTPTSTQQAYLFDPSGPTTTLLSQFGGTSGNQSSYNTRISQDGKWACFVSYASNLGFKTSPPYVVRIDLTTKQLYPAIAPGGAFDWDTVGECTLSGDGSKMAFDAKVKGSSDRKAWVTDFSTSATAISDASPAASSPLNNYRPRISADGKFACFHTPDNLVPADTDGKEDVYVADLTTPGLSLVSVDASGNNVTSQGAFTCSISGDGRYVTFQSNAGHVPEVTNSVNHVYVRDRTASTTKLLVGPLTGIGADSATISHDGAFVAFITGDQLDPADSSTAFHFDAYRAARP